MAPECIMPWCTKVPSKGWHTLDPVGQKVQPQPSDHMTTLMSESLRESQGGRKLYVFSQWKQHVNG